MGIRRAYPLSGIAYSDILEWLAHEKQKVVNMMWNSLVFMWFSDFHVVQWFHVYTFLFPRDPVLWGRNEVVWPFGVKHHVFGLTKRMQAIGVALAKTEKVQFCFKFPSTNHVRSSWNTSEYNMNKYWTNTILNISIMFRCLFLLFFLFEAKRCRTAVYAFFECFVWDVFREPYHPVQVSELLNIDCAS